MNSNSKISLKMNLKDRRMKILSGDIILFSAINRDGRDRLGVVRYLHDYIEVIEIGSTVSFEVDIESIKEIQQGEGYLYADTEYVDIGGDTIYINGICDIDIEIKSISRYEYK